MRTIYHGMSLIDVRHKTACIAQRQGWAGLSKVCIELYSLWSNYVYFIWKLWNQSFIHIKTCYWGVKGEGNPFAYRFSSSRSANDFCLWYLLLLAARAAKEATWFTYPRSTFYSETITFNKKPTIFHSLYSPIISYGRLKS